MLDVKKLKELEPHVHFELYRVLKNYVDNVPVIDGELMGYWKPEGVFAEVSVDGERADLVITIKGAKPFLVIETKRRVKGEGASCAWKMMKAKGYAEKTNTRYYAVCNGWIFLLFHRFFWPYLVGVYGVEMKENFAMNLFMGLAEYEHGRYMEKLNLLPAVPDVYDVEKKVIPPVAKRFVSEDKTKSSEEVMKEAEQLLKQWIDRIKQQRALFHM